ncbi:hypothetical protein Tco_0402717, partial [Tanacetum coccineum]
MLRACPHHGFSELTQIDTFYNGLNDNNQDSLNVVAGGIIETIHVDFDELIAMASEHSSSGPALHEITPATISSGLVPNPPPLTPFVPPSRTDWDMLFQPLFDELLNPPPSCNTPKNVSQRKYVRERYFIIQQLKI